MAALRSFNDLRPMTTQVDFPQTGRRNALVLSGTIPVKFHGMNRVDKSIWKSHYTRRYILQYSRANCHLGQTSLLRAHLPCATHRRYGYQAESPERRPDRSHIHAVPFAVAVPIAQY